MTSPLRTSSAQLLAGEMPASQFDLAITMAGLASRSSQLSRECALTFRGALLIEFEEESDHPARVASRRALSDYFRSAAEVFTEVTITRDAYIHGVASILQHVDELLPAGQLARVLVDISALPRYYIASLLAQLFFSERVGEYVLYYAQGDYVERNPLQKTLPIEWSLIPIDSLRGVEDPSMSRGFLVSVGFEASRVNRLLSMYGPDAVWLLEPQPGFKAEYSKRALDVAERVLEYAGQSGDRYSLGRTSAGAGDIQQALKSLENAHDDLLGTSAHRWTLIPCGTRPHCAALTLFALLHPEYAVATPTPDEYMTHDITANGTVSVSTIVDNSLSR